MSRKPVLCALFLLALFVACGDDGPTTPTPSPAPAPATPSVTIEASGHGDIVIHPSADPTFAVAIEFPIQIQETAGGTAIWNYFRASYFRNGVEIERNELGATDIRNAGYRDVGARATMDVTVISRTNALDWDDLRLALGFIDKKDGRSFEHLLSLAEFDDVLIDLTPAMLPDGSTFAIVSTE
jgi:hypothetical protein